jgi:cytochrome c553
MISKLGKFFIYSLFLALMSAHSFAAGNAEKGAIRGETCLGCHGVVSLTNVYPTYKVPKLGGQHSEYIIAALKSYRSGERNHPTMQAQAAGLSDQEIEDVAAYLASLGN